VNILVHLATTVKPSYKGHTREHLWEAYLYIHVKIICTIH